VKFPLVSASLSERGFLAPYSCHFRLRISREKRVKSVDLPADSLACKDLLSGKCPFLLFSSPRRVSPFSSESEKVPRIHRGFSLENPRES